MTTITVNIDNKKSEKAIKAVLDALGVSYNIEHGSNSGTQPLSKSEQKVYKNLKTSFEEIRLHQDGKTELKDARDFLNEL